MAFFRVMVRGHERKALLGYISVTDQHSMRPLGREQRTFDAWAR